MVASYQSEQAEINQTHPSIPVGVDCGAGLIKVCIGLNGAQIWLMQPSKVLELRAALIEDLSFKEDGHFCYHSGDRTDLTDREFLTGELAALFS